MKVSEMELATSRALMRLLGQTPPPLDRGGVDRDDPRAGFVMRMMENL